MHVCMCLFVSTRIYTCHITYVANRGQLVAGDSFHFVCPGMEFIVGVQAPLPIFTFRCHFSNSVIAKPVLQIEELAWIILVLWFLLAREEKC